ncbi:hypothetical protein [Streptomyces sp. NPDC000994]
MLGPWPRGLLPLFGAGAQAGEDPVGRRRILSRNFPPCLCTTAALTGRAQTAGSGTVAVLANRDQDPDAA